MTSAAMNMRVNVSLHDFNFSYLGFIAQAQANMNKWDHIILKTSAQQRKQAAEWKCKLHKGWQDLQAMYLMKGEYRRYVRKPYNSIAKNKNNNNNTI